MHVAVDMYEPSRAIAALASLGVDVTVRRLPVGDYVIERGVVIERKTISDLRRSLVDGRLWRQLGELRKSRIGYLIVEGPDVLPALRDADAVRGALLSIADLGLTVVRSRDAPDTAAWVAAIARRRAQQLIRRRSAHIGRSATPAHTPPMRVLAAIDGVSETRAKALLGRFGSVANIAHASIPELMNTPGVHATIAKRIHASLH
jgi:ERCC4-type nuclease